LGRVDRPWSLISLPAPGKTTPLQLLIMVVCEMVFYSLNEAVGVVK
jgi:hypothetical protein